MALRAVGTAGYGLLLAFSPGINPTEWLDTVEDFFFVNDVPSARQAASARLLMTKAVRRELFPPGSSDVSSWTPTTTTSPIQLEIRFSGLRQRKDQSIRDFASEVAEVGRRAGKAESELNSTRKLRLREQATLTKTRQLTERLAEIEKEIKEGRRRAVNDDATESGGLVKAVDSLARRLEKMETAQDRPSRVRSTRRPTECFQCSGLAMAELQAGHAPSVAGKLNGLEISLLLDSGAVVSVSPLPIWHKSTGGESLESAGGSIRLGDGRRVRLCGQGTLPLQVGSWRGRIHVAVVESLVDPGRGDDHDKLLENPDRPQTRPVSTSEHWMRPGYGKPRGSVGETRDRQRKAGSLRKRSGRQSVLRSLLRRCGKVISCGETDFERTNLVQHRIETGGAQSVKLPPRCLPQAQREAVDRLIREMLQTRVIKPTSGRWSSPVVLVRKKDGSPRFCFSTPDLASGYWQVEVAKTDQEKTVFSTPMGLFQFRLMPFVPCNAPATFQRLIEKAMKGLTWKTCLVYLDDIIVFGKAEEEHLQRLDRVLSRLQFVGLKIKPEKCQLMRHSVHCLSHIVTQSGIGTDPEVTEAVQRWPTPRCVKEVWQFLGRQKLLLWTFCQKLCRRGEPSAGTDEERGEVALGAEEGGGIYQHEASAGQPPNPRPPRFRPHVPAGCRCQRRRRWSSAVSARGTKPTSSDRKRQPLALTR
ncbi:Retrovirus-related Pol polyprotein from transposon 17.6 [Trichinella pseudospiralis]|uniref:Retrovirus-related Pol polyprotein from transposon 17.6 n=2 Tax=Trichinella pseudospiralis TaxID=6337 RepID=A0A0V1F1X9_TRIPS|nr:Retrovirus-related Pol polyprotein from transposon 17.6 [Trichinella pseudospiralis]